MAILSKLRNNRLVASSLVVLSIAIGLSSPAHAQIIVNDDRTDPVETNGEDITIENEGTITVDTAGPALVLNSDNNIVNSGSVTIEDVSNAVGVSLEGGENRNYTQSGSVNVNETFEVTSSDADPASDGPFAEGTGRTGILISGSSPFEGNVELTSTSSINIEGTDSFGINLSNTSINQEGLIGDLTTGGAITVRGARSTAINISSGIIGDFTNTSTINGQGDGTRGMNIEADIQGGFVNSGGVSLTGYRSLGRPTISGNFSSNSREQITAEDILQAGSAITINANITEGIHLDDGISDVLDDNGNQTFDSNGNVIRSSGTPSTVVQNGSAPAILIGNSENSIVIGNVAQITDPNNVLYESDLQYAFVNQGGIQSNGVYDDIDATALSINNTLLNQGINNTGQMTATAYVAPQELTDVDGNSITPGDGQAIVIALSSNSEADVLNNSGVILASSSEAIDLVYNDLSNVLPSRNVSATGIDIDGSSILNEIINSGSISAVLVGRQGTAYAIRDQSGSLSRISNTGTIGAIGTTSDPTGNENVNFTLVAIDASQNTNGFVLEQNRAVDSNPDDGLTPADPNIFGEIKLGVGNDSIISTAGNIRGNIDFNFGDDNLSLSGNSFFQGAIYNQNGLNISVTDNSTLVLTEAIILDTTSVNFDGSSTFSPLLDGNNGTASTLQASNNISFESGATIAPTLTNVVGINQTAFTVASAGGQLTVGDLAALSSPDTPFLFNTSYDVIGNDLVITLQLRDSSELGLDQVQSSAYAPAIQALRNNTELGDAFANITTEREFNSAFNQVLPEFSAAARQFVLANVDGAVGAVANHLDSVRRSPDKPGGAWLQEFAYFADRELSGLSEQYRGAGFGISAGLDTALGPFHAVGLNLGFSSTEIEDVLGIDEPLDVITIQAGAYAGWASGPLGIETYLGGGFNDFEQNRRVRINSYSGEAQGDWSGVHVNSSARIGYDLDIGDKYWIRPTLSLDYLRLSEKSYTETGDKGIALDVDKRTTSSGSATAMFNLGAKFQGKRTWIKPSIRFGYRYELINNPVKTSYRYANLIDGTGQAFNSETAQLQSLLFPDSGFIIGLSVAAGSVYSSIGLDLDSELREGFIRHTGRVVVRLLF